MDSRRFARSHVVVGVDDDPAILSALERLLRDEPYEFLATDQPDQALEWVRSRQVSLVISDYRMPCMSGTELLRQVRASSPETARILLTAYPGEPAVIRAGKQGLLVLLPKPWSADPLRQLIRAGLRAQEGGRDP